MQQIIFPFIFIIKIFHQCDRFLSVSNTAANWISYRHGIHFAPQRCITFVSCFYITFFHPVIISDKVSPPKFDFLEFIFYRKTFILKNLSKFFRIINNESSSEICLFLSDDVLCIHNRDSLKVERSLTSCVGIKRSKKRRRTRIVVQIVYSGATTCITEAYCILS